jgi:hypothetical protein
MEPIFEINNDQLYGILIESRKNIFKNGYFLMKRIFSSIEI